MESKLKSCPKCGGAISLYPQCYARENGNNCFAHCNKCHTEFIVEAFLEEQASYNNGILVSVQHTKSSIMQAQRAWNKDHGTTVRERK